MCPAVKSAEIIGDKWILLILRELFFGTTRFNEFQRALPRISPTILSKRLKKLEADGLIIRKTGPNDKTKEYRLTGCGRELGPVVEQMAIWGLRWARRSICDEDLDVASFMWDFHRTLNVAEMPDGETVISVTFPELKSYQNWWLVIERESVDLCTDDPGKDVDLYISSSLSSLVKIWMGDIDVKSARVSNAVMLTGSSHLMTSASRWFPRSSYADIRPVRLME